MKNTPENNFQRNKSILHFAVLLFLPTERTYQFKNRHFRLIYLTNSDEDDVQDRLGLVEILNYIVSVNRTV